MSPSKSAQTPTPGPWTIDDQGEGDIYVQNKGHILMAVVPRERPESLPNARLIAAAPTVTEACSAALTYLVAESARDDAALRIIHQLDAALVLARGTE